MTRKVITIEFSKCPYFKRPALVLSFRIDFEGKITPTSEGLCGLKGDMTRFLNALIFDDIQAGVEIFGKSYSYDADIQKQVDYLKGLVEE